MCRDEKMMLQCTLVKVGGRCQSPMVVYSDEKMMPTHLA